MNLVTVLASCKSVPSAWLSSSSIRGVPSEAFSGLEEGGFLNVRVLVRGEVLYNLNRNHNVPLIASYHELNLFFSASSFTFSVP
jgi:hypothetical protein